MATRKKLPNLKICVDNTDSTDESEVEIKGSSSSSSDDEHVVQVGATVKKNAVTDGVREEEDVLSIELDRPTERRFLSRSAVNNKKSPAYGPKIYENKVGNFVTGVDITSKEAAEKREKRGKKFGTLSNPKQPITDIDIKNLYRSLGMNIEKLDEDPRGWRMEAILLRGTDNLSTQDIFDYFKEYAPKNIEWIDDFSCNVVWLDKLTPARALLKLSSSMSEVLIAEKIVDEQMVEVKEENMEDKPAEVNVESKEEKSKELKDTVASDSLALSTTSYDLTSSKEPVLNVLEDEMMELDYDDNLDLTEEDPIDQAISTWSNFSNNKKIRSEQANLRKSLEEKSNLSAKEKLTKKIPEKEDDSSEQSKSNILSLNKNSKSSDKSKLVSQKLSVDSNKLAEDMSDNRKKDASKVEKKTSSKTVNNAPIKSNSTKDKEKMEVDYGSESDSSTSSSSASSSSSSSSDGSSSSGSSSGSDSDSGSASTSSSSSSSSDQSKQKKKKTRSERNIERGVKKSVKKPEAPPVLPQSREKSDIPWPPGWWRLGQPHTKAEYLFMRYAMKADKKLPGAEKRSKYYLKYGNPNYGGIRGLISNSRKQQLRNFDKNRPEEDSYDVPDMFRENGDEVQSRLAGRLGVAGQQNIDDVEEGELEESDDLDKPLLKEGRDLRDLLNREVEAVPLKSDKASKDSDDEMDYGAELDRLMKDNAPPAKKRFMRMHADDEEEKIERRRLAMAKKERLKQLKSSMENNDDVITAELEKPARKQWVDYDNVEDDDPFNLFGTSKVGAPHQFNSDIEEEDGDDEENTYYGKYKQDDHFGNRREKSMKLRLGGGIERSQVSRADSLHGVTDLRAKLQGRRTGSRNW